MALQPFYHCDNVEREAVTWERRALPGWCSDVCEPSLEQAFLKGQNLCTGKRNGEVRSPAPGFGCDHRARLRLHISVPFFGQRTQPNPSWTLWESEATIVIEPFPPVPTGCVAAKFWEA